MPSPFPGMDPYLEDPAYWSEFHSKFINCWQEDLADVLPEEYEARLGERVYLVEHDPDARRLIYPDVALEQTRLAAAANLAPAGVAVLEPVTIPLIMHEGPKESHIEILKRPERSLVAVLELLSPGNKENPGRQEYLAKRNALLFQNVHLVELDLLLHGRRLPTAKPLPAADYYYLVSRAEERPNAKVYHWRLPQPLQSLPVPLAPPHADVWFDLARVFKTTYERGRYARSIAYHLPCPVSLPEEHAEWATQMIQNVQRAS